jgi:hypothetical protein
MTKLLRGRRIELLENMTIKLRLASVDVGQHRRSDILGGLCG